MIQLIIKQISEKSFSEPSDLHKNIAIKKMRPIVGKLIKRLP
jgi:hypothetical protein